MKKKVLEILLWAIGIVIAIFILFALDYLVNDIDKQDSSKEKVEIAEKYNFNQYGLPEGRTLSEIPFFEDENYVFYSDRLLKKFEYNQGQIENQEIILQELSNIIPKEVDSYFVPIPGRIVWEDDCLAEVGTCQNLIEEIKAIVPKDMGFLDILSILKEHQEENLFFRTEDSWTARGAYYGSEKLLKHIGIETITLEEYDEHLYSSFEGLDKIDLIKEYREDKELIERLNKMPLEPNYYYLLPNTKNRASRTKKWKNSIITENIRMVSKGKKGQATFIGGNYLYAVAEGEGLSEKKKDKTILLLADISGHMLLPFLVPYYEKVYIINIANYEYDYEEFQNIFREYNVSEIIMVNKGESIGDVSKSKFFKGILNAGKKE